MQLGKSAKEELSFSFGILEMLRQYGTFKDTGHFVTTTLKPQSGLACSSRSQSKTEFNKTISLNFKFNYKIEITPKTDDKVHVISENIVEFQHRFDILNEGTSPTNKDTSFFLEVPKVVLPGDPAFTDESKAECKLMSTTTNKKFNGKRTFHLL